MVALLVELGAPPPALAPGDAVVAALLAGDADTVARLEAAEPGSLARARRDRPGLAVWPAANGRTDVVALVLDHGFGIDALGRADVPIDEPWETALHGAVVGDHPDVVDLLLDRGADVTIRDRRFQGRPLDWARHLGRPAAEARLAPVTPDEEPAADGG
jgi:hypothetical protein